MQSKGPTRPLRISLGRARCKGPPCPSASTLGGRSQLEACRRVRHGGGGECESMVVSQPRQCNIGNNLSGTTGFPSAIPQFLLGRLLKVGFEIMTYVKMDSEFLSSAFGVRSLVSHSDPCWPGSNQTVSKTALTRAFRVPLVIGPGFKYQRSGSPAP